MAPRTRPLIERFEEKIVRKPDGCWEWQGTKTHGGYGQFKLTRQKKVAAHRLSYELSRGQIPEGLTIDHLCRNPSCVNPDHLEPVTLRENLLRGTSPVAENARKTHCLNGHPLSGENLRLTPTGGRVCRACNKDACRRYYLERKAA